jgi:hypothetical protein
MASASAIEMVTSLPADSLRNEWLESGTQFKKVKVPEGLKQTAQTPIRGSWLKTGRLRRNPSVH